MKTCRSCQGTGSLNPHPCVYCHGKGSKMGNVSLDVKIPSGSATIWYLGISRSSTLKVPFAGHNLKDQKGDLYINFEVFAVISYSLIDIKW